MHVRRLDLAEGSADRAAAVAAWRAAVAETLPQLPLPRDTRLRASGPDGHRVVVGAFKHPDDAVAVGLSVINESTATALTFWVAPELRRRGIGSVLLAESLRVANTAGRATLAVRMAAGAESEGFARERGGRLIERQVMSGLELGAVDRRSYEQWAAPSAANAGYALVRWSDRCPDDLAQSFCAAMAAMADAPGDDYNEPATVKALRQKEQQLLRFGVHRHVQAAVAEDGNIAGFTNLVTVEDEPRVAEVWHTAVVRSHRRRGLGRRVKAAAALWLLDEYPESSWIHTFNHPSNAQVLKVNQALGYRPLVDWFTFEFDADRGGPLPPTPKSSTRAGPAGRAAIRPPS